MNNRAYFCCLSIMFVVNIVCMERAEKDKKKSEKKSAKKSVQQATQWIAHKVSQKKKPNSKGLIHNNDSQLIPSHNSTLIPSHNSTLIQNNDTGLIQSKESLKFDIMFMNGLHRFGYREIFSFAINKKYYEMLHNLAPERKEYLISSHWGLKNQYPYESPFDNASLEEIEPICWNRNGTACGKLVTELTGIDDPLCTKLRLCYWFLADRKGRYRESYRLDQFVSPLSCVPKMRFCANGDLCCYGWGKEQADMTWGAIKQLMEYSVSQNGVTCQRKCGLDIGNGDIRSLLSFRSSSILLEAFLNSSVGYQTDTVKVYTLKDALIPFNHILIESELTGLPQDIQEAVRKHYLTQHRNYYPEQCKDTLGKSAL